MLVYCRGISWDKNSTVVHRHESGSSMKVIVETWTLLLYIRQIKSKYICHLRVHNSAIMTWIKFLFHLWTCSMHIGTVLQVWNPCIKYKRRSFRETAAAQRITDIRTYGQEQSNIPHSYHGDGIKSFRSRGLIETLYITIISMLGLQKQHMIF